MNAATNLPNIEIHEERADLLRCIEKNNFWEPPLLEIDATDPPVKSTSEASFDAK